MRTRLRKDRAIDVAGIGQSSVDHLCVVRRLPRLDSKQDLSTYSVQPGGQVPTALVALQRWGCATAYAAALGDDPGAELVRRALALEGVDIASCVRRPNVEQQVSVILVDEVTGERSVMSQKQPALHLTVGELPLDLLPRAKVLLMDAVDIPRAVAAAECARRAGTWTVLDIDNPSEGIEQLLALTDVLIVGADFPGRLTGITDVQRALRATAKRGPWFTCVTLGTGGAFAIVDGVEHYVPAYRVPVVDSTGAGDAFHAGCIYGLLQGWEAPATLRFAAAAAALKCGRLGGRDGIPTVERALQLARQEEP